MATQHVIPQDDLVNRWDDQHTTANDLRANALAPLEHKWICSGCQKQFEVEQLTRLGDYTLALCAACLPEAERIVDELRGVRLRRRAGKKGCLWL
jgi:transposase-like protein